MEYNKSLSLHSLPIIHKFREEVIINIVQFTLHLNIFYKINLLGSIANRRKKIFR